MRFAMFLLTALSLLSLTAHAAPLAEQDSGKDVYGPCAACHGEQGQGGKRGEYPRIAGQRHAYIESQLRRFRSRERMNIPMFPYTQERELSDADIKNVATYLASIALQTKFPDFKDTDDALTRLEAMEKVMIIPRLPGDLSKGKALYNEHCAHCHGSTGMGVGRFPMLVGQYTNYLMRQIDIYLKGERSHDVAEDEEDEDIKRKPPKNTGTLGRISAQDIEDILAHITHLQDSQP